MDDKSYNTGTNQEASEQTLSSASEAAVPHIVFGATQGKKGHKSPRINMAFSPDNHKWIKTRSKQLGISATELVNTIIERERLK